jgi:GDP-L-fucose synthase
MLEKNKIIFVAGHNGLVGSSVVRRLNFYGYKKIILRNKKQLDLRNQNAVDTFFKKNKIDAVINAAGTVGGIYANNKYKANFIYDNLSIQNNIIHSCYKYNVKNLIFLGSSCIYPRDCKQPIKENYLLTGKLEKTNEPYAVAKIAGVKMCESYNFQYKTNYKCLMPCNLYGPNDNYDLKQSHFLPALIYKIHNSKIKNKKTVVIWGTGKPKRELLFVDDLADACIFFLNKKVKETLINIGSGEEMKIIDYAKFIIKELKTNIKIKLDLSKPDGTPRKIIDSSIANKYGWKSKISFKEGFKITYLDYLTKNLNARNIT